MFVVSLISQSKKDHATGSKDSQLSFDYSIFFIKTLNHEDWQRAMTHV